jgi:predicted nucleotidyltransferase
MTRDEVLTALRAHETELRQAGVTGLSVFGSVARGDASSDSDVDLAVQIEPEALPSGFGYFGLMDDLRVRLAAIVGRPVDLVAEPVRRPGLRQAIERDRAVAF